MKLSAIAKFIDQPQLINSMQKHMPKALIGAATLFGVVDTFQKPKGERKKQGIKNAIILGMTVAASLIGANGLRIGNKQIIKGFMDNINPKDIIRSKTQAVGEFLNLHKIEDSKALAILNKVKEKLVKPKEIDYLIKNLPQGESTKKLLGKLFGEAKNLTSKEIFSEIGKLSGLGLVPVLGGVTGGIIADKVTKDSSPKKTANKIKEGAYQYLANIFLCNVGAGAGLLILEKLNKSGIIKAITPAKKLVTIITGIMATGVIGGSFIANWLCKRFIDPVTDKQACKSNKDIYGERKPEALDLAMHTDDIATAGVLAGLKWIEPALPLMYAVSGYRAGIGYRNSGQHSLHGHNHSRRQDCKYSDPDFHTHGFTSLNNRSNREKKSVFNQFVV